MPGNSVELFHFTWTIENMTVWNYERRFQSPCFVIEELGGASFHLELVEKVQNGGFCTIFLRRSKDDNTPEQVTLKFKIGIPKANFKRGPSEVIFNKTSNVWGWDLEISKIFNVDDWFLRSGDVEVECTIFESDENLGTGENKPSCVKPQDSKKACRRIEQCCARTRLKSELISVKWNIQNFSKLTPGEKATTEIFSFPDDVLCFLVSVFISSVEGGKNVEMSIENLMKPEPRAGPTLVACKVSFYDIDGIRIAKTNSHVYDSNNEDGIWKFPVLAGRKQLIPERNDFLPTDILSLLLEFKVCDGIEFSKTGKTVYGSVSRPEIPSMRELTPLKENSLRMFKEQQTCDVSFETPTKTIRAHKFILFANSSVFKAMFDHETLEKQTNTIQVSDVSSEALERFLEYLYSERLEGEVSTQLAAQLYFAADKYGVDSLKNTCSSLLRSNLRVGEVCEMLSLADRHQDQDLKDSVRGFFSRRKEEVLDSDEWKALSTDRPQFALECLQWLCRS